MTGEQVMHQLEFRWQPDRDFSVIASSFDSQEQARTWSARIAGPARPMRPDRDAGVPERSIVYRTFASGTAALIWRHYQREALSLYPQAARQPLVARALIGDASVLTAGLAMAVCHADYVGALIPPTGQVPAGARLEPVDGTDLRQRFKPQAQSLDSLAQQEPGLVALVATALRHPGTPLSVVLPGAELAEPPGSAPALLLLWGLWRTTAPLITSGADGGEVRGWSFSSYEPPLGSSQAGALPAIVFRSQEQERRDRQPLSYRTEVTVRPRQPSSGDDPAAADPADHIGSVSETLVSAFRSTEPAKFWHHLKVTAARRPGLADRLSAIERTLRPAGGHRAPG